MATAARVLWVIKGLGPGGAEGLLVDAAEHLDRDRFSYEACYLLPWKDQLAGDLDRAGVRVTCLDVTSPWNPSWVARLRGRLRDGRYDVVHAHLPYTGIGVRTAARSMPTARPAVVYTEHNTWNRYRPATRLLNAWTFGWNDAVIAVSQSVAASIGRRRMPVNVVPNGIDVAATESNALGRREARSTLGIPDDAFAIGTVGGLTPKKGHSVLVRAAARVVESEPSARFSFVGLAAQPSAIEREIAAASLEDHVILEGYRPAAARLMRAFDVYCLPSLYEGMPVSLLEAMALGVPSVVTSAGGVPEVVTDGADALVVPPSDSGALADALVSLARDDPLRAKLAAQARRTVERFDLKEMVRRTEAVYLEALSTRR